ncbi:MAG TPA: hypothetical protein VIK14_15845 [Ignavibacteria bacterium]
MYVTSEFSDEFSPTNKQSQPDIIFAGFFLRPAKYVMIVIILKIEMEIEIS